MPNSKSPKSPKSPKSLKRTRQVTPVKQDTVYKAPAAPRKLARRETPGHLNGNNITKTIRKRLF